MAKRKINLWNIHHESLGDAKKIEARNKIQENCEWSMTTFYAKKKDPDTVKKWERQLVAAGYGVPVTDFWPAHKPVMA